MPLIRYACDCGFSTNKFFKRGGDAPKSLACEKCPNELKKKLSGPSLASKITIDNGVQGRAIEIQMDVIEANKENSKKNFREK